MSPPSKVPAGLGVPPARAGAAVAGRRSVAPAAPAAGFGRGAQAAGPALRSRAPTRPRPRLALRARRGSARSARGAPRRRARPPDRGRRARTQLSARGVRWLPCRFSVGLREQLPQAREPREHPALDRTDGLSEPLRKLGLCEAPVVGELERLTLLVGQLPQCRLHPLAFEPQPRVILCRVGRCRLAALRQRLCASSLLATHEIDRAPV